MNWVSSLFDARTAARTASDKHGTNLKASDCKQE
jgi:hypothetical protein